MDELTRNIDPEEYVVVDLPGPNDMATAKLISRLGLLSNFMVMVWFGTGVIVGLSIVLGWPASVKWIGAAIFATGIIALPLISYTVRSRQTALRITAEANWRNSIQDLVDMQLAKMKRQRFALSELCIGQTILSLRMAPDDDPQAFDLTDINCEPSKLAEPYIRYPEPEVNLIWFGVNPLKRKVYPARFYYGGVFIIGVPEGQPGAEFIQLQATKPQTQEP